jgi:hypothetical protein
MTSLNWHRSPSSSNWTPENRTTDWNRRLTQLFVPILLAVVLLITGCAPKAPSPYAQVQQETTQRGAQPAVAKTAEQGSSFNKFFPGATAGYERVFTQEKKGFAEAKLKKDGKDMAMLAVSDTTSLPGAAQKFATSTVQVAGFPAVEVGTTQTAVLVANRYQVKVLSRDPAFTKADRLTWLQRFDLNGLAKVK